MRKKKTIDERLREASDRALERLRELVDSEQSGIALKASDSILDRNPETARNQRVEGSIAGRFTIDPVTLMHAAMTAKEIDAIAAKPNGGEHVLSAQQREGDALSGDESRSEIGEEGDRD